MANVNEAPVEDTSGREIVVTRLLNAPRELVFTVFTKPEHIVHWWGPKGFINTIQTMDVRPGGTWRFILLSPNGVSYPNVVVYQEVVPPERLAYTHGDENDHGQFKAVITLEEVPGNKTFLTMRAIFKTAAERDFVAKEFHAVEGAEQNVDKLEAYLANLPTRQTI